MSTPNQLSDTPRTDLAWAKTFEDDENQYRAGNAASDMREECERLERDLTTEREKAERYRLATLKLDAELADWSVLKLWGGTPEIIHKFVKGQQERIHYCQDIEAELATERARLDSGTILLTVAGERVWHCGVDLRAAIDAGIQEGAK